MTAFWSIPIDRILIFDPSALASTLNWLRTGTREITTDSLQLQYLEIGETIVLAATSAINILSVALVTKDVLNSEVAQLMSAAEPPESGACELDI